MAFSSVIKSVADAPSVYHMKRGRVGREEERGGEDRSEKWGGRVRKQKKYKNGGQSVS